MTEDEKQAEKIIDLFNEFIEKWCVDNYPHLIDSDENDGERFRQALLSEIKKRKSAEMQLRNYKVLSYEAEQNWLKEKSKEFENKVKRLEEEKAELGAYMNNCPNCKELSALKEKLKKSQELVDTKQFIADSKMLLENTKLKSKLKVAVEALEWKPMDCGDTSCHFAKDKSGMRTNGGCRCHRGHPNILKTYMKQKEALTQIKQGDV